MTIFISQAIEDERIAFGPSRDVVPHGRARWRRLAALYRTGLVNCGFATDEVVRPEIYQTAVARSVLGVGKGDWHLAVKPTEHLRPFHGIANAFVFDGVSATASVPRSPFQEPTRVLSLADVVFCTTASSVQSLRAEGVEHACDLPPSVATPKPRQRRHREANDGDVQIGTWIESDSPDTLESAVDALAQARKDRSELRLVVGMVPDASLSALKERIACRFGPDTFAAISFVSQDHDGSLGGDWLAQADFVLPKPGDAFSLYLAEAMLAGIPPVASGNATGALVEAASVDLDRRRANGEDARKAAEDRFGLDAFRTRISELERRLRGDAS